MLEFIAEGLPMEERRLALAVQGQSYGPMFDEKLTVAAWKTKPTWAVISTKDQMLPPAMQASAANKMGAVTTTLSTCHMSILEEPGQVAAVIDQAARAALKDEGNPTRPLLSTKQPGSGLNLFARDPATI
jgi:pimeloyl-ACP methyl ester carboxylesterase